MKVTEDDLYQCDFCGGQTGEFNTETGNHVICDRLADLEKVVYSLAGLCDTEGYDEESSDGMKLWATYKKNYKVDGDGIS